MSTELSRLSELAKAGKTTRFLSLAHLLTPAALMAAFEGLRKDASAGVDDVTCQEYEQDVWRNIPTLHHRLVSHQYRVQPLRRVYIPKRWIHAKGMPTVATSPLLLGNIEPIILKKKIEEQLVLGAFYSLTTQDALWESPVSREGQRA